MTNTSAGRMDLGLATIVVPAYNVEDYIEECLESLRRQTYSSIEILVVDDGSTDGTQAVVRKAMGLDKRIKLFCNENHGVSYSRNYAIERGSGKYLLFVDADDVVAPDYVEALVAPLSREDCECSAVGIGIMEAINPQGALGKRVLYHGYDIYKSILNNTKGFICNKGFLYYIVQYFNIRLREDVAQSEDMLFLLDYLSHCSSLIYDSGIRYCYRKRGGSATIDLGNLKWFDVIVVYNNFALRLGGNSDLLNAVKRHFLPIAYEGMYRYRFNSLNDKPLRTALLKMRDECEECLIFATFRFRIKMFIFKHATAAVIQRRLRGAE